VKVHSKGVGSNENEQVHRGADRRDPPGADKGEQMVEAVCRARGITVQTFYRWRRKYGGVEVSDVRHMR